MGYEIDEYGQAVRKDSSIPKKKKYKIDEYGQVIRENKTASGGGRSAPLHSTQSTSGNSYNHRSSASRGSFTESAIGTVQKTWAIIKLIGWSLFALMWLLAFFVGIIEPADIATKIIVGIITLCLAYASARRAFGVWEDEF